MKYLAYYDTPDNREENRSIALAATNKITYICSAMNRAGIPVEIISASATENRRACKGKTVRVQDQTTLKLFGCMGTGGRLKRVVGRLLFKVKYFAYLLFHIRKNEKVIVYHSMGYASIIMLLKRLKKFYLILEAEEIYADVSGKESKRTKEIKLLQMADAYIFPTELLHDKINKGNKPYTVIYGSYRVEDDRRCQFEDGKLHCVYAGTLDPRKGCIVAAEAAKFLPEKYHIHILGFGQLKDKEALQQRIEQLSKECRSTLSYDGCLNGEQYIRFIQSCAIGLSPQNADAKFNDTSFPSKILSYLSNGLQVVSIRIPSIEKATIGNRIHFFDESTPDAIAKAIMSIKFEDRCDCRSIIKELDKAFVTDIKKLLEE